MVAWLLHDYGRVRGVQDDMPTAGVAAEIEKPRREPGLKKERKCPLAWNLTQPLLSDTVKGVAGTVNPFQRVNPMKSMATGLYAQNAGRFLLGVGR